MGMWKSERWPRYGKNTFPNVIVSPLPHLLPSPYSPYFHSLDRSTPCFVLYHWSLCLLGSADKGKTCWKSEGQWVWNPLSFERWLPQRLNKHWDFRPMGKISSQGPGSHKHIPRRSIVYLPLTAYLWKLYLAVANVFLVVNFWDYSTVTVCL